MGYYVEVPANHGKVGQILAGKLLVQATGDPSDVMDKFNPETMWAPAGEYKAVSLGDRPPAKFEDIPEGAALICVVDNGIFEAACFVYCEREFEDVIRDGDSRPKTFMLISWDTAVRASGIPETVLEQLRAS